MAENKLKERWNAGKAAANGWLAIPSGFVAEGDSRRTSPAGAEIASTAPARQA